VDPEPANAVLVPRGTSPIKQRVKLHDIQHRPQDRFADIAPLSSRVAGLVEALGDHREEVVEQVEVSAKYAGYMEKERKLADKLGKLGSIPLDPDLDYERLTAISTEARQKLAKVRPTDMAQAARISGVSPADLSVLLVYLGR
jgi:tRNA uridine 5-carboxymethylaminomethyl modification enzyme